MWAIIEIRSTPEAAAVVKQKGELAIAGKGFPNAYDQCRLITPPSTFAMQLTFAMLPLKNGDIAIVYDRNMNFRHIRMNGAHPTNLLPSPMGNSVGNWEGDTLVVDTVGIQTDAFTQVDRFGTPQSDDLVPSAPRPRGFSLAKPAGLTRAARYKLLMRRYRRPAEQGARLRLSYPSSRPKRENHHVPPAV